jgi:hypothetical protein
MRAGAPNIAGRDHREDPRSCDFHTRSPETGGTLGSLPAHSRSTLAVGFLSPAFFHSTAPEAAEKNADCEGLACFDSKGSAAPPTRLVRSPDPYSPRESTARVHRAETSRDCAGPL